MGPVDDAVTPQPSAPLVVQDAAAWRAWLDENEDTSDGVWLILAKKGTTSPTSVSYAEALDEALCSGWIDGQRKSHDAMTFLQRFTPRRTRSLWSLRNLDLVAGLIAQARMRSRGLDEIEKAKRDGRWERAYAGPAAATVPDDLAAALAREPEAEKVFAALKSQERYAVLHPIMTAATSATREKRIARQIELLMQRAGG